ELDRLRQQALSELEKLFDETFGTPPTNFVFEGKKMNRKDYAKMTIPDDMWDLTFVQPKSPSIKLETVSQVKTVYPQPNIVDPELLAWRIVGNFVGDAEWRSIDDAIERSLRANEPVLFGVQIKRAFIDRKSTRLNSSHVKISYAVFCLKKKNKRKKENITRMNYHTASE